jgi:aspartyl-tRNA(Asn)/glutamyl-tRNA(Gln) amidotransferase subunit A
LIDSIEDSGVPEAPGLVETAELIVSGEISAVDVVTACLNRIESRNPELACFREVEAAAALQAAASADMLRAGGGRLGPLHGIPLAHKDIFFRAGKTVTAGSPILKEFRPHCNSTIINRLDQAGAITVGTLQSAEFAMSPTGYNAHIRPVRNPWNPRFVPGGSSMGSGAAVAARMVQGSLGTDTGGSVRHPAAVCGVTGLKPSQHRVSRHGIFPLAQSLDCAGILARSARDVARILGVIAGHDPEDQVSSMREVPDYEALLDGELRGLRIGIPRDFYFDDIDPAIEQCLESSLEVLRGRGAECVEVDVIDIGEVNRLARTVIGYEAAAVHAQWLTERPEDYSEQVRSRIEPGLEVPDSQYFDALRRRGSITRAFCDTSMAGVDLLYIPCVPVPTPSIEAEASASPQEALQAIDQFTRCTRGINYLGLPALSVPCGFIEHGLPAGFQFVGRPFEEGVLLKAADAFQRETDWHRLTPE